MPDSITTQLERHFERLTRPHAQRRLLARWANDCDLAGRTPTDIIDLCEQATIDQNPVVAALLTRHQAGDPDAGIVLLTAMQPMVKSIIALRHSGGLSRHVLDNYWSAVAHLIGTIDPTNPPHDRDGQPTLFVSYLGNLVYSHLRKLDPASRRFQDRKREGRLLVTVDLNPNGHIHPHHRTEPSAVEDAAIARIELARLLEAVDHGDVTADRWQQLVEHRLGIAPTPRTASDRVAIHRTANRLAGIIGHAA